MLQQMTRTPPGHSEHGARNFSSNVTHFDSGAAGGTCDLCGGSQKWLFIFATGRSGSSTILDMVDGVPFVYIAGENKQFMTQVREMYEMPERTYNMLQNHTMLCHVQGLLRDLLNFDNDAIFITGFKEISHCNWEDLRFFQRAFPCAKYILNYRKDLEKQIRSGMYRGRDQDKMRDKIEDRTETLIRFADRHADIVYHMPLEEFGLDLFNNLLRWMGVHDCNFTRMVHSNSHGTYTKSAPAVHMDGTCTYNV